MKKIIATLLAVSMMFACTFASAADFLYEEKEITVTYNGKLISFDTEPQIINDRTMVPFRAIFETLGGEVGFDEATREVSCKLDDKAISFKPGDYEAVIKNNAGEEKVTLDAAPVIVDDRTLVPVRFVAESAGVKVNWDEWLREVVLIDTEAWKAEIAEKSELLAVLLDSKLFPDGKFTAVESGEVNFSFAMKNLGELYTEGQTGPEKIDVSLNIKANTASSYDGTSIKESGSLELDLTSVKTLLENLDTFSESLMTAEDRAMVDSLLKSHKINIETIVDKDFNIYLKSAEIIDLITIFDGGETKALIGDKYVLIPFGKMIDEALMATGIEFEEATAWDIIDYMIRMDEYIDTQAVKAFESMFDMMTDLYGNDTFVKETAADGTVTYLISVDKAKYVAAMEKYLKASFGYDELDEVGKMFADEMLKENLALFNAMEYDVKMSIAVKDGVIVKTTANTKTSLTDYLMPGSENVLMSILLDGVVSASLDRGNADTIIIPTNVFDITTIQ